MSFGINCQADGHHSTYEVACCRFLALRLDSIGGFFRESLDPSSVCSVMRSSMDATVSTKA